MFVTALVQRKSATPVLHNAWLGLHPDSFSKPGKHNFVIFFHLNNIWTTCSCHLLGTFLSYSSSKEVRVAHMSLLSHLSFITAMWGWLGWEQVTWARLSSGISHILLYEKSGAFIIMFLYYDTCMGVYKAAFIAMEHNMCTRTYWPVFDFSSELFSDSFDIDVKWPMGHTVTFLPEWKLSRYAHLQAPVFRHLFSICNRDYYFKTWLVTSSAGPAMSQTGAASPSSRLKEMANWPGVPFVLCLPSCSAHRPPTHVAVWAALLPTHREQVRRGSALLPVQLPATAVMVLEKNVMWTAALLFWSGR